MDNQYSLMCKQLESIIEGVDYDITNYANVSALIFQSMEGLNWAGFYFVRNYELVLGPFQGKTACTKIAIGSGVCGTAVAEDKVQRVADVHKFPGHIACDSVSNSEIVIPLHVGGEVIGVLDIDSPEFDRFSEEDEVGLIELARIIERFASRN